MDFYSNRNNYVEYFDRKAYYRGKEAMNEQYVKERIKNSNSKDCRRRTKELCENADIQVKRVNYEDMGA